MSTSIKKHLVLMRPGFEETLKDEFSARYNCLGEVLCRAGVAFSESLVLPKVRDTVFARQVLPRALRHQGEDIAKAVKFVTDRLDVMTKRSNRQSGSWTLHAFAIDDDDGLARARNIAKQVMAHVRTKQKDFFLRYIAPEDFAGAARQPSDLLIQIYAPAKDDLWFSVGTVAEGVSLWEGGFHRMKTLRGAPSRSASKLEEALSFLGAYPSLGQSAVDLGAAPGGWSFVLARHGAHVVAVDHAALGIKDKSSLKGRIEHLKENGIKFLPPATVDWMVCDMVMGARDTLNVLNAWHKENAMLNFVVNIKLPKKNPWPQVHEALNLIEGFGWPVVRARHLLHDRSEVTLIGSRTIQIHK